MSVFPSLVQEVFPDRVKHFLVAHTVTYRQWDNWGPSFTLRWTESILAAKCNRDTRLCLSLYLCSISLTATPTRPCMTAVRYQRGRSCPLPGVPAVYGTFRKVLCISERTCSQTEHIVAGKNTADVQPWQFFTFLGRAKSGTCGFSILLSP